MIRLLAFDLDGTTITEHKYLSSGNREALLQAAARGVALLPATGRMFSFVPEEILSLPGVRYVITSNGGAVYDLRANKVIFQRLIPNEKAVRVQEILDACDVYVEYYQDGRAITRRGNPELAFSHFKIPEAKRHFIDDKEYTFTEDLRKMLENTKICPEKINLPYLPGGLRRELWQKLDALGGLRLTSSLDSNIEINSADAEKGSAVLEVAKLLGVAREEVMAIGDNGNDVTMLRAAGLSVAVGDGTPEALAAADYPTAPHDEDGVAEAIKRFIVAD